MGPHLLQVLEIGLAEQTARLDQVVAVRLITMARPIRVVVPEAAKERAVGLVEVLVSSSSKYLTT